MMNLFLLIVLLVLPTSIIAPGSTSSETMIPSSVYDGSVEVEGKHRLGLPAVQFRLRSSAFINLKPFFYKIIFGEERWKDIIAKHLPTETRDLPILNGLVNTTNMQMMHMDAPVFQGFTFTEGKIKLDMKGIKVKYEFDFRYVGNPIFRFIRIVTGGHVTIDADDISFTASLKPYFRKNLSAEEIEEGAEPGLALDLEDAELKFLGNLKISVTNSKVKHLANFVLFMINKFARTWLRGMIETSLVNIMKENIPESMGNLGKRVARNTVETADDYIKDNYGVSVGIAQNVEFENANIRLHDEYLTIETDMNINLDHALGQYDREATRYWKTTRAKRIHIPNKLDHVSNYFDEIEWKPK